MSEVKHVTSVESKGQNESQVLTPRCSCGWVGTEYARWHDHCRTMIKEQLDDHSRKAQRGQL